MISSTNSGDGGSGSRESGINQRQLRALQELLASQNLGGPSLEDFSPRGPRPRDAAAPRRTGGDDAVTSISDSDHGDKPEPVELSPGGFAHLIWTTDNPADGIRAASLYLGPKEAAPADVRDAEELSAERLNIGGIVNCTTNIPLYLTTTKTTSSTGVRDGDRNRIRYCYVPVYDADDADLLPYLDGATKFVHYVLTRLRRSVLVHCQFGVSRSSSVVVAYLMRYARLRSSSMTSSSPTSSSSSCSYRMTRDEAYAVAKRRRPQIFPNPGFWRQLGTWEERLKEEEEDKQSATDEDEIHGDLPDDTPARENLVFLDKEWAMECLACYSTCRDLPNGSGGGGWLRDECWCRLQRQLRRITTATEQVARSGAGDASALAPTCTILHELLLVCLDFVWGRGLLQVDLEWLAFVCQMIDAHAQQQQERQQKQQADDVAFLPAVEKITSFGSCLQQTSLILLSSRNI